MIDGLINEIISKRLEHLEAERKIYPRERFIASDLSICDRYMVYSVLNWKDKKAFDADVVARLQEGRKHEKEIIRDLLDMGFEVVEGQIPFEIPNRENEIICRGRIDGKIQYNGSKYPFEIKTMNANVFNGIKTLQDFEYREYLRKYLRQMQMYLFGNNIEQGIFILDNMQGQWKLLRVDLDYGECERILAQLERCWEHKKTNQYPDPIAYSEEICGWCGFSAICLRDIPAESRMDFSEDKDLETMCDRYTELKPLSKEYEIIDEAIKSKLGLIRENKDIFIGDRYRINIKMGQRRNYNVPDEVKAQYLEMAETKTVKVIKFEEANNGK